MYKIVPVSKNAVKWATIALVAVLAAAAINLNSRPEVKTEVVKPGSINELVELQGKVELEKTEKIYSKLQGFVDDIYIEEGDNVETGRELLRLSTEELEFAIAKATAAYNASQSQVESLKSSIKPEHLKLAEAQLEQAKAAEKAAVQDYNNTRDKYEKTKILYDNGASTEAEMNQGKTLLAAAESAMKNAEQAVVIAALNLNLLKAGVPQADLEALKANAEAAKVEVSELVNNKGKTSVHTSIDGVVLAEALEKGQAVAPGEILVEIGDYSTAYIKSDVLVDDIHKIKEGQKAVISGDVLGNEKIGGQVYYIAPRAESRISSLGVEQQRVEVRIRFDNHSLMLKPGYTLDIDIVTREKQNTIYVSDKSVFELNGIDYVFVVVKNKLELRAVETGIENDDCIEVVSGLSEGERVILDPQSELKPGQRIRSKER